MHNTLVYTLPKPSKVHSSRLSWNKHFIYISNGTALWRVREESSKIHTGQRNSLNECSAKHLQLFQEHNTVKYHSILRQHLLTGLVYHSNQQKGKCIKETRFKGLKAETQLINSAILVWWVKKHWSLLFLFAWVSFVYSHYLVYIADLPCQDK